MKRLLEITWITAAICLMGTAAIAQGQNSTDGGTVLKDNTISNVDTKLNLALKDDDDDDDDDKNGKDDDDDDADDKNGKDDDDDDKAASVDPAKSAN